MADRTLTSPDRADSPPLLPVLLLLFMGSGCAALIYEVIWLQMLQLVIGSTAVSMGVLLGTFMGGMCLGSLLLPRLVSVRHHPLRVYALLELGIGICALAVLFGMPLVERVYASSSAGAGWRLSLTYRGLVSMLCLLLPTMLMGATLPGISRWISTTPTGVSWLGFLYGGNIVGAVVGCLVAGFYLLRVHDMRVATYVGVGINVGVAAIGLLLAGVTRYWAPQARGPVIAPRAPRTVYMTIALSGLSALGAEVVWTRVLSLMLGATVYTFSIILAVFLLGLGIGSSIGSVIGRASPRPRLALGVCQLLLVGAIAWTAFAISHSLPWLPINPALPASPWCLFQLDFACCMWAILPGAMLWGASFPLALSAAASRGQDPGRLVGGVYAANTVGAILGSLGFAMFIVPACGTRISEQALVYISAGSAMIALAPMCVPVFWRSLQAASLPVASFAALLVLIAAPAAVLLASSIDSVPWQAVAWGRYTATWASRSDPAIMDVKKMPEAFAKGYDRCCSYVGEGINVTVAVVHSPEHRYFHGAGKVQASTDPQDMRLQRMLGHIAALIHGKPEDVLVVACGAGVTAGSFVPYDSVKRIVICDIEPLVPKEVAPVFFAEENHHVITDSRTQVVEDDGRHFVRTTIEKFDIITSDPIDPWVKGCAALNTVEYYQMCKDHLKPGGVMALWIPLYESSQESINSVITTFFKVFPNGILWSNDYAGGGYDAVLFGQVEPTKIDIDAMQAFIDSHPKVRQSLEEVGFGSLPEVDANGNLNPGTMAAVALLATYAGQARDLKRWMRDDLVNYDINLRLQYLAGMWLNQQIGAKILDGILRHYRFPDEIFTGSPQTISALKRALFEQARPQIP